MRGEPAVVVLSLFPGTTSIALETTTREYGVLRCAQLGNTAVDRRPIRKITVGTPDTETTGPDMETPTSTS